ncbi:MAG: DUF378 domain-containing protein [Candidatus Omnitrophica bacterium]|nr:DUF378 domain-containing protein [Candidatus Omnitrophota bacterium]
MKALNVIALILVIVGGVNWGLVGIFNFDLVAALLGDMTVPAKIVYSLVGLAAIYSLVILGKIIKE